MQVLLHPRRLQLRHWRWWQLSLLHCWLYATRRACLEQLQHHPDDVQGCLGVSRCQDPSLAAETKINVYLQSKHSPRIMISTASRPNTDQLRARTTNSCFSREQETEHGVRHDALHFTIYERRKRPPGFHYNSIDICMISLSTSSPRHLLLPSLATALREKYTCIA